MFTKSYKDVELMMINVVSRMLLSTCIAVIVVKFGLNCFYFCIRGCVCLLYKITSTMFGWLCYGISVIIYWLDGSS